MRKMIVTLLLLALTVGAPLSSSAAAPDAKPLRFKVDHGVQQSVFGQLHLYEGLRPVRMQDPVYPRKELLARIIGTVTMDVLIAEDGSVTDVRVRKSSGNANLDAAALAALHQWKYPVLTPAARYANVETWEFMIDG